MVTYVQKLTHIIISTGPIQLDTEAKPHPMVIILASTPQEGASAGQIAKENYNF